MPSSVSTLTMSWLRAHPDGIGFDVSDFHGCLSVFDVIESVGLPDSSRSPRTCAARYSRCATLGFRIGGWGRCGASRWASASTACQQPGEPAHAPQVRVEPPPAELPEVAAVAEQAVDDERDDLRPAVDDDHQVVQLARLEQARVAVPAAFGAAVVEHDLHRAAGGGLQAESLSPPRVRLSSSTWPGAERVEAQPQTSTEKPPRKSFVP